MTDDFARFTLNERLSVREGFRFTARPFETLLELFERPHLLVAIEVMGALFPHRDAEPFVRVANADGWGPRSWITRVAEDGSAITGYFATDARLDGGTLEFGYGDAVYGRIPSFRAGVEKLDRSALDVEPVVVTTDLIRRISKVETDEDPLNLKRE